MMKSFVLFSLLSAFCLHGPTTEISYGKSAYGYSYGHGRQPPVVSSNQIRWTHQDRKKLAYLDKLIKKEKDAERRARIEAKRELLRKQRARTAAVKTNRDKRAAKWSKAHKFVNPYHQPY